MGANLDALVQQWAPTLSALDLRRLGITCEPWRFGFGKTLFLQRLVHVRRGDLDLSLPLSLSFSSGAIQPLPCSLSGLNSAQILDHSRHHPHCLRPPDLRVRRPAQQTASHAPGKRPRSRAGVLSNRCHLSRRAGSSPILCTQQPIAVPFRLMRPTRPLRRDLAEDGQAGVNESGAYGEHAQAMRTGRGAQSARGHSILPLYVGADA